MEFFLAAYSLLTSEMRRWKERKEGRERRKEEKEGGREGEEENYKEWLATRVHSTTALLMY